MPLLYGSPAIDAGNNTLIPAGITTDQRGDPRIFNGTVDIGAYELQAVIVPSFVVNTTADFSDPTDGLTSLREAIASANAIPGHTITFSSTVFNTPKTITLSGAPLDLSDATGTEIITGSAAGVTVNGGGLSEVFQVDGLVTASISGLTITGGKSAGSGGGVKNLGSLALNNFTVSGNSVNYANGGGVNNSGSLEMTNCTVSGNSTAAVGGGVFNNHGSVTMTNCTVSGNSAYQGGGVYGGGAYDSGCTTSLANTIVAGNTAGYRGPDLEIGGDGVLISQGHNLIGVTDWSSGRVGSDLTGTTLCRSTPSWPRWATMAGRRRPCPCFTVARRSTRAIIPSFPQASPPISVATPAFSTDGRHRR